MISRSSSLPLILSRRDLLRSAGAVSAGLTLAARGRARERWRTFDVTTHVEVLDAKGVTRIWLPSALAGSTPFQKTLSNTITTDGAAVRHVQAKADRLDIVTAEFPAGVKPVLTLTSRIATTNYAVDLSAPRKTAGASRSELEYFTRATKLLPTDGIVKETAARITLGATTDIGKARAIYQWIVENTFRDAKTRGCGVGDIRFMLESGNLGGKCADLNALYVGLARASGLPARDVYGIRVAPSELGYKSLGAATEDISKAQHCRAEVYIGGYGWAPVDPADVRKVVLEEPPGNRSLDDAMVQAARARLFGSWEMNWMAYNFAHDVVLPGSSGRPVGFLMYPQAETNGRRLDSLDPASFSYRITSREILATNEHE
ncbi:MAG TPA: transglutaminase-like domain-containing protein [Bryobacteraceae bacterium]|nr:transglutaminase-like domain-containing protein [Bryobacteraceae bacterium]